MKGRPRRLVMGIGVNDAETGVFHTENHLIYDRWKAMIRRLVVSGFTDICDELKYFSKFKELAKDKSSVFSLTFCLPKGTPVTLDHMIFCDDEPRRVLSGMLRMRKPWSKIASFNLYYFRPSCPYGVTEYIGSGCSTVLSLYQRYGDEFVAEMEKRIVSIGCPKATALMMPLIKEHVEQGKLGIVTKIFYSHTQGDK